MGSSVKKEIYSVGMSEGRPTRVTIMKLAGCCLLAGVVVAIHDMGATPAVVSLRLAQAAAALP